MGLADGRLMALINLGPDAIFKGDGGRNIQKISKCLCQDSTHKFIDMTWILILFDIAMAKHLILAEDYEAAKDIIEKRLEELPSDQLLDLLRYKDEDITEATDFRQFRIQLLELLDTSKQNLNGNNFDTVFSLAVYNPFELSRIEQLENFENRQIAERARAVKRLLSWQGLQTDTRNILPELSKVSPLSNNDLDLLRHPLTRKGDILGKLQEMLAKTSTPDFDHMRQFCKKATPAGEQLIIDIVSQTCLALGLLVVPAYISHGEKSVGVRAFEADPNFILIGSKHVEPDSDYFLSPLELTFAIVTELTHLKFKHSRVTSRAVVDGSLEKGKFAIETIATLLPFLKFIPINKIMSQRKTYQAIRSVVPLGLLKKIYSVEDGRQLASKVGRDIGPLLVAGSDSIKKLKKGMAVTTNQVDSIIRPKEGRNRFIAVDEKDSEDISPSNDKLVVAHRAMQRTADRTGLIFCGNILATVRSMFLTSGRLGLKGSPTDQRQKLFIIAPRRQGAKIIYIFNHSLCELCDSARDKIFVVSYKPGVSAGTI